MRLWQPEQVAGDTAQPAGAATQRLVEQRFGLQERPYLADGVGRRSGGVVEYAWRHQPAHRLLHDRMNRDQPGASGPVDEDEPALREATEPRHHLPRLDRHAAPVPG